MPGGPVLLLIGLHLDSMLAMPPFFWRVRRLERELRAVTGVLRVHRWLSRRSLLLTVWCQGPDVADSCLAAAGFVSLAQRAGEGRQVRVWAERYAQLPGAVHLGASGAPAASEEAKGDAGGTEGREGLGGRHET
ncbi:MAG TPA: hypothetical protein VNL95_03440 [Dehalococcoidia bacterium]|nr:hypothetical protein [Dehalococcoidia bacterium]